VEGVRWATPGLLFLLLFSKFFPLSFCSVPFRLLSHVSSKFSLQLFLVRMIDFLMPGLSIPSGEGCVALPTDEFIDGGPLQIPCLAGRLPESLLLFGNLFLHTIDLHLFD
jgi:hypothetical protein